MVTTGSSEFDPQKIISYKFPDMTYTYSERNVALYALGVGACAKDAVDDKELKFVYYPDGQKSIQVLPTFAALFSIGYSETIAELPGLQFDPRLLLHGQQYIEIYKPLPSSGSVINRASIAGLHDKGKATVLEVEIRSYEKVSGDLLCMNRMAVFLRGAGGFSKSSNPYSYSKYPANQTAAPKILKGQPFVVFEEYLQPPQKFKCWNCNSVGTSNQPFLVCEACGSVQHVDESIDYFQIFGLEKKYDIEGENLERKYKDWQRKLHPDLVHTKSEKEKEFAAEQPARVKLEGWDIDEEERILDPELLAEHSHKTNSAQSSPWSNGNKLTLFVMTVHHIRRKDKFTSLKCRSHFRNVISPDFMC